MAPRGWRTPESLPDALPEEEPVGQDQDIARIRKSLLAAKEALVPYTPGAIAFENKGRDDPVTAADRAVNTALRTSLVRAGEGWLSEETLDDHVRLKQRVLWIIDPIDGTREFVKGIPEWAVSVGKVEDGRVTAGGVFGPQTGELFLGAVGYGTTLNDAPVRVPQRPLKDALVLASRSEMTRGEWRRFDIGPFRYTGIGSIAYKLALVAAGKADATFTLQPKNEWDVAGGVALVEAAGGCVVDLQGKPLMFNRRDTLYPGLIAGSKGVVDEILSLLATLPSAKYAR